MKLRHAIFNGPGSIRRALKDAAVMAAIVWFVAILTITYHTVSP